MYKRGRKGEQGKCKNLRGTRSLSNGFHSFVLALHLLGQNRRHDKCFLGLIFPSQFFPVDVFIAGDDPANRECDCLYMMTDYVAIKVFWNLL